MQFDWMSSVIGFLVGTAIGASGKYFADKFTDQRRGNESAKQLKLVFLNIKKQMPELIEELKTDFSDNKLTREFFVLINKKATLGGSQKHRFIYYEEEHENLRGKIDLLENQGFLTNVTTGNAPIYRMTEEFVDLLNKYG
jgi:hypothetical protein